MVFCRCSPSTCEPWRPFSSSYSSSSQNHSSTVHSTSCAKFTPIAIYIYMAECSHQNHARATTAEIFLHVSCSYFVLNILAGGGSTEGK